MVISLSSPACAVDPATVTTTIDFIMMGFDLYQKWLELNPDSDPSEYTGFNPGGIYGGGGGRDDLSAAYSSYVSDIESECGLTEFSSLGELIVIANHQYTEIGYYSTKREGYLCSHSSSPSSSFSKYGSCSGGTPCIVTVSDCSRQMSFCHVYWSLTCPVAGTYKLLGDNSYIAVPGSFSISSAPYIYSNMWHAYSLPASGSYTFSVDQLRFACTPSSGLLDVENGDLLNKTTRPTSITGNYGIIGDDGQLISVGTQTIVNEGSSTYYNPVTSTTYDLSGWTYDYSTRTYDLSTTSGDMITVEYADESVNITEGDTVYNVYYVVEQEPVDPSTCEHTYTCEHTTLPSCTQAGLDTYTCSLCGDTYTQTVAAAGHTWTVKQSVNTQYDETGALVTEGYTIYECSTCGEQYKSTDGTSPPNSSGSSSGGTIGGLLESLISGLGSLVGGLISGLLSLLTKAVEALGGIGDLLSALWGSLGSIFEGFTGFLAVVFPFLPEEFLTILEFGFILLVGAGIIKKFSS